MVQIGGLLPGGPSPPHPLPPPPPMAGKATICRQATLAALTPDIVGKWCVRFAPTCSGCARVHTTSMTSMLPMHGAFRIEHGEGRDGESSQGWLLIGCIALGGECSKLLLHSLLIHSKLSDCCCDRCYKFGRSGGR
jgi:hypothetical protein